ncbi:MAG: hypothetical protein CMI02_10560 [Oceanospirillaceae bacterium]|nr:hypothetical protein [Oceanospirillaceae bacterium]
MAEENDEGSGGGGARHMFGADGSLSLYVGDPMVVDEEEEQQQQLDPTEQFSQYREHVLKVGNNWEDAYECDVCGGPPQSEVHFSNGHGGKDDIHFVCEECEPELQVIRDELLDDYRENSARVGQPLVATTPVVMVPPVSRQRRRRAWLRRMARRSRRRGRLTDAQFNQLGLLKMKERMGIISPFERQQLRQLRLLRSGGTLPYAPVPVPFPATTRPYPATPAPTYLPPMVVTPAPGIAPPSGPPQVTVLPASQREQLYNVARSRGIVRVRFPWERDGRGTPLLDRFGRPVGPQTRDGDLPTDCFVVQCPPGMPEGTTCWQCYDITSVPPEPQGSGFPRPFPGTVPLPARPPAVGPPAAPAGVRTTPAIIFDRRDRATQRRRDDDDGPAMQRPRNVESIRVSDAARRRLGSGWFQQVSKPRPVREVALIDQITDITLRGQRPQTRSGVNCVEVACPPDFDSSIKCWKCTDAEGTIVAPPANPGAGASSTPGFGRRPSAPSTPATLIVPAVQRTSVSSGSSRRRVAPVSLNPQPEPPSRGSAFVKLNPQPDPPSRPQTIVSFTGGGGAGRSRPIRSAMLTGSNLIDEDDDE